MPKKNKDRLFHIAERKPLNIGMRGVVAYCDNGDKRLCKKCMLHGFYDLTSVNLICRPIEDYPEEYKQLELKAIEELKKE